MSPVRIGIDVGGTHTDLAIFDPERQELSIAKVPSTPSNPAIAVLEGVLGLRDQGIAPEDVEFLSHGTTVTTNALLQLRGARLGMLITRGFRGIQEVQSQFRHGPTADYFYSKPSPLVRQSATFEVTERVDHTGAVLTPLNEAEVAQAGRKLRAAQVESVLVCYLFSYMNPSQEIRTREILRQECPELPISLSSEVLPRIREWRRMSTTLLNAYLEPMLLRYLAHLEKGLREAGVKTRQLYLMQSNGGVMPFEAVVRGGVTVQTLMSGPAAGVRAASFLCARQGYPNIVTLDMGGTSCDIAFMEEGKPLEVTEWEIDGREVDVPSLEVTSISAGGGTIGWVDSGGGLNLGPHSAGAEPGPACYGRGGTEPTITDADLFLGYLNPAYFLGGREPLRPDLAAQALQRVAERLAMSLQETAFGFTRIANTRMADKVRVLASKRGIDPGAYTLVPFGGAGPVHAVAIASELGIKTVVVPPRPGAFSALGLLCTDVTHDYIRSDLAPLADISLDRVNRHFEALEADAREDLLSEGLDPRKARFERETDMRYAGQGFELRVGAPAGVLGEAERAFLAASFHETHERLHGHRAEGQPVEIVSYRLRVIVEAPKYQPEPAPPTEPTPVEPVAVREVRYDLRDGAIPTSIFRREDLPVAQTINGPAIIEQLDATTVIPPGWRGYVDQYRNLVLAVD